jgi:hypothetical protein
MGRFVRYHPVALTSKSMSLHKITDFCTDWFSICSNKTSNFRTIAIFKSVIKQTKKDSNKTFSRLPSLAAPIFICLGAAVHELSSQNKV